jgi:hypothetical protein
MAKHDEKRNDTNTQASNGADATTTQTSAAPQTDAAAAATAAPDERYRKVVLDDAGSTFAYGDTSKSGQTVNRIDFIRSAWQNKQGRGSIAKEVSRLVGKKITYQIVFSATKGVPGGPTPAAQPAAAAPGQTA